MRNSRRHDIRHADVVYAGLVAGSWSGAPHSAARRGVSPAIDPRPPEPSPVPGDHDASAGGIHRPCDDSSEGVSVTPGERGNPDLEQSFLLQELDNARRHHGECPSFLLMPSLIFGKVSASSSNILNKKR